MLHRVETIEKVCHFRDVALDLPTRLTRLETWLDLPGVTWDETFDFVATVDFVDSTEFQFGGKDELCDSTVHVAKLALRRWTFRIRAIEDRLNEPRHLLLCLAWIYGQVSTEKCGARGRLRFAY